MTPIIASGTAYLAALCLPSYAFISADQSERINQHGLQSLFSPPIGMAVVVNILYFLVMWIKFSHTATKASAAAASVVLALVTMTAGFGCILGDPQPGSRTQYGFGAWMWLLALGLAIFAKLPSTTEDQKSRSPSTR